jgi:hypothetical protein
MTVLRLADRKTADRVAVETDVRQSLGATPDAAGTDAALHDAENRAIRQARRTLSSTAPPSAATRRIARSMLLAEHGRRTHSSSCIEISEPSSA